MEADRYVCMRCHRGHDAPGFCPHCARGELLDMRIASDRELLQDRIAEKKGQRRRGIQALIFVVLFIGLNVGLSALFQDLLGWSFEASELLVVVLPLVLMVPVAVLLHRQRTATPGEEAPLSEIDPVAWEDLVDEPLHAEDAEAEPVARRPRPVQRER